MTIAVGLLCSDGVVLGADREVTLDTAKIDGQKAHILKRKDVSIGVVGAGSADLVTLAAQALDRRLVDSMSVQGRVGGGSHKGHSVHFPC